MATSATRPAEPVRNDAISASCSRSTTSIRSAFIGKTVWLGETFIRQGWDFTTSTPTSFRPGTLGVAALHLLGSSTKGSPAKTTNKTEKPASKKLATAAP